MTDATVGGMWAVIFDSSVRGRRDWMNFDELGRILLMRRGGLRCRTAVDAGLADDRRLGYRGAVGAGAVSGRGLNDGEAVVTGRRGLIERGCHWGIGRDDHHDRVGLC